VKTDKIYLVGFMAAGKTSVARALAERLGWQSEDIDNLIEAREQRTVAEIFARDGEPYFRTIEREILHLLLPLRRTVIATGGGTFVEPANRATINLDGVSVWLDVPVDLILDRAPADGSRPLATNPARLRWLYETRRSAYEQAHVRIDAAGATVPEIVDAIVGMLTNRF
jgi:shikimate kinase